MPNIALADSSILAIGIACEIVLFDGRRFQTRGELSKFPVSASQINRAFSKSGPNAWVNVSHKKIGRLIKEFIHLDARLIYLVRDREILDDGLLVRLQLFAPPEALP